MLATFDVQDAVNGVHLGADVNHFQNGNVNKDGEAYEREPQVKEDPTKVAVWVLGIGGGCDIQKWSTICRVVGRQRNFSNNSNNNNNMDNAKKSQEDEC